MFFSSREVCVHYFVTRLLRPLSPQEVKPTTSGLYSWPFVTFWLRRHAKDALEKIHWSIATRITYLSCWMHSRKTNNLITDWIVVFLSHLELHTGAKFFFEQVILKEIIWKWITRRFIKRSPFYFTMLKSLVLEKVEPLYHYIIVQIGHFLWGKCFERAWFLFNSLSRGNRYILFVLIFRWARCERRQPVEAHERQRSKPKCHENWESVVKNATIAW